LSSSTPKEFTTLAGRPPERSATGHMTGSRRKPISANLQRPSRLASIRLLVRGTRSRRCQRLSDPPGSSRRRWTRHRARLRGHAHVRLRGSWTNPQALHHSAVSTRETRKFTLYNHVSRSASYLSSLSLPSRHLCQCEADRAFDRIWVCPMEGCGREFTQKANMKTHVLSKQ
jgi:hypothetical protein